MKLTHTQITSCWCVVGSNIWVMYEWHIVMFNGFMRHFYSKLLRFNSLNLMSTVGPKGFFPKRPTEVGQMTKSSTRICASRLFRDSETAETFVLVVSLPDPQKSPRSELPKHHFMCFFEENHWTSCSRQLAVASWKSSMFFWKRSLASGLYRGTSNRVQEGIETSDMMNMMSFILKRHHF